MNRFIREPLVLRIRELLERSTRDDVNICILWMLCYRSTDVSCVCVTVDAVSIYAF